MNSAEREGKSPAKKRKPKSPPPASPEDSAGHTQLDTALQEIESQYRTVFESTGTAMVIIEEDTTIGFANKEFFRLTGYSQEDIDARKRWTEFVHRDDREKMIARHAIRCKRPKDPLGQYEFRLITKSGEIRNILLTIDMFPGTQRSIASLIDVTDKKRVEDALTASESRLRGIIRVAPIGIGVVVNRVIIEVNDQICTMTGYSAGELIGQSARVFYPTQADFAYVGQEKYEQIARKGTGIVETRWLKKDGGIIDILLSSTPLDPTDLSAGVTFTALDITERNQAEEALQQSEIQYRNLAETIQDFIITTDFDGIISYANPVALNLAGGSGLVGRALKELMDEEQVTMHREMLNARRTGLSETLSYEWYLKSPKDGSSLLLDVRSSLLMDKGKPSGVLFYARDITERKQAEEALRIQHTLTLALTTCHTMKEALELTLDAALQGEGLDSGGICVADPVTGALDIAVHRRLSPEVVAHISHFDADAPQVLRAKTGIPFYGRYEDIRPPGNEEIRDREGVTALASIPVLHGGNLIAIMNMVSHIHHDITAHTRTLLETLATQISGALVYIRSEDALRESEEKYRLIAENTADNIWIYDMDLRLQYISPSIEKMKGFTAKESLSQSLEEVMTPASLEALMTRFNQEMVLEASGTADPRRTVSFETEEYCKSGATILVENSVTLLRDAEGRPVGMLGVSRDITERKKAEETLRESEERFRKIFDNSPLGMTLVMPDFRFFSVNPAWVSMTGYSEEELLKMSFKDITHPDHLTGDLEHIQELVAGTIPVYSTEKRYIRKDGSILWGLLRLTTILDRQGTVRYVGAQIEDITKRKKSEEALLKSETRYRELFELLPQTIFEIDNQGKITSVNPAGLKLFGYAKEELEKGVNAFEIFAPMDHQRLAENIQRIMRGELSGGFEYTAQRKDGSTFPVITYSVPIIQEHTAVGLRGVLVDISERKAAEEALKESEDRFRTLADAAMEGIMIHDRGIILDCNPQFAKLFGYEPEEIIGKNGFEFMLTAESRDAISRWSQNGAKGMVDIIGIKKDRTRFSGETASTTILWQGKLRSIVQMNDITERKRAAEALRVANEKYSKAFLSAPDAITISELDSGRFIEVNEAASTIFGYASDEMIGKSALELGIWLNQEERGSFVDQIRALGRVVQYEVIQRRKSGEKYYASVTADTIGIGNSRYLIAIIRDITRHKHMEEALRVSEEKYRIVSEMAKDGIAIVQNNKLVYVNPSLAHIGGYSVEELTGASFLRFVAPESVVDLLSIIKNRLLGKPVPEFFTTRIRHRDGHTIEIEANGTTIIWEGEKALLGIIRDVTERRQAEKALQESQDLYQTLAESSPDMVYLIDREGYIRYVNSLAARQFRLSPTELMGKRLEDLFPADIARHHMAGITRTITTGQPQFSEIFESFPTQDYWINARLNPVKDAKGVVTHVLGISTDITEHKRAEQALKDDEAKLRTVFESIQAGIVIIDPVSHKIVDINSVASNLIGAPKEKLIGQVCHQFICPAAEGMCPISDLNQTVDNSERILLTMNKKEVPILKTVVPIMLNGRQHLLESFIDISERKRAEEELLALNRDLEGKVLERTEGLNNSLKDKELLLREIHHRVKNNLQIIISLLNLQSRYITDEKTLAAIRESQNRVKAMALVHEKLYQSADIAKINLDDYVRFLGNSLFQFYGMRGKSIMFTTVIPEITLDINTAIPIGLIINELVSNSLKYAFPDGERGEISIAMKRDDHIVTILFKDTGISIPADFDWRNAKSLGLRLVISLVEQLSGTIELDRTAGTAFTIVVKEKE